MQIVIDIDDNLYTRLFDNGNEYVADMRRACVAIRKGTPLPKGHGRLIDADALKKYIDNCDCCVGCEDESYGCADKCRCPDYLDEDMERIINNQPTIIEADKEVQDCISRAYIEPIIEELENICVNGDEHILDLLTDIKNAPPVTPQPKIGKCKNCRWWKDSDGAYRRGVGAESQCPINRREVYKGDGYCYMYKPQESEDKELVSG